MLKRITQRVVCSGVSILAAFAALGAMPADAAMRRCGPLVASEIVSASQELEAKAKALAQWRAAALKLGAGFGSWRIATDKALKCVAKPKTTLTECVAVGRPCIIEQKPKPRSPAGRGGKPVAI